MKPLPFKQYLWQVPGFPAFTWDKDLVANLLGAVIFKQGQFLGQISAIGFEVQQEAALTMTIKAVKDTSVIEGEVMPYAALRSSVGKRLKIDKYALHETEEKIDALVNMMADAMDFNKKLTESRILSWHGMLFVDGLDPKKQLYRVAEYRKPEHDPMVVVSHNGLKSTVHFQAPPAEQLAGLMSQFVTWCLHTGSDVHPILKSAIAHLWFVTIHPFDDGNGRIGRTIADYFMACSDGQKLRFYSVSSAILKDRKNYYLQLEQSSKGDLDITTWLCWYLQTVSVALDDAEATLAMSLNRARFWNSNSALDLNNRQKKVLNLLLGDFKGKVTTVKYSALAKTSQDSASRDLQELVQHGLLTKLGQGKATHYLLVTEQETLINPFPTSV